MRRGPTSAPLNSNGHSLRLACVSRATGFGQRSWWAVARCIRETATPAVQGWQQTTRLQGPARCHSWPATAHPLPCHPRLPRRRPSQHPVPALLQRQGSWSSSVFSFSYPDPSGLGLRAVTNGSGSLSAQYVDLSETRFNLKNSKNNYASTDEIENTVAPSSGG